MHAYQMGEASQLHSTARDVSENGIFKRSIIILALQCTHAIKQKPTEYAFM